MSGSKRQNEQRLHTTSLRCWQLLKLCTRYTLASCLKQALLMCAVATGSFVQEGWSSQLMRAMIGTTVFPGQRGCEDQSAAAVSDTQKGASRC